MNYFSQTTKAPTSWLPKRGNNQRGDHVYTDPEGIVEAY